MDSKNSPFSISKANSFVRSGNFSEAIYIYVNFLIENQKLANIIWPNIATTREKYRKSRENLKRKKVGICSWRCSDKLAERVYVLAKLYDEFAEVNILDTVFTGQKSKSYVNLDNDFYPTHITLVEDKSFFIEQAVALVASCPYDVIHIANPSTANIMFAVLYKILWDAKILIDLYEDCSDIEDVDSINAFENLSDFQDLIPETFDFESKEWLKLSIMLIDAFDGITLSNAALKKRYDGKIVKIDGLAVLQEIVFADYERIKIQTHLDGSLFSHLNLISLFFNQKKKLAPSNQLAKIKENIDDFNKKYKICVEEFGKFYIKGWCVNSQNKDDIFDIQVYLDGSFLVAVKNNQLRHDLKKKGLSGGLGGFLFSNPVIYLNHGIHTISFRFPNGKFSNPFEVEGTRSGLNLQFDSGNFIFRPVTIIVPIFNAPKDLEVCIERLLSFTPNFASILLIDDCSTDSRVNAIISRYAKSKKIRAIKNLENLGFTRTVNRGIEEAGEDDVILLNSDARVTPRWLESMLLAAYSAPRIATVTAMSDRAGAFSAPMMGNDNKLPEGVDEITYSRAFRRRSLGLYPRVPTGNGFCMYVRRECINSIGLLDADAFPRGYGEENDFCMRAMRAGWFNIIDDRTYVFHDRSKSFGEAKTGLMAEGRAVVDKRYPEYKKAISVFSSSEKINLARNRARIAMRDCIERLGLPWLPRVLFVVATQTGGTPQTNRDLMGALSGVIEGWVLRCNSKMLELSHMNDDGSISILRSQILHEPVDPISHNSSEYDRLVFGWLEEFDFDLVHIRHLGWHGLSLPKIARQLGQKVVFSFHDFYALSPSVKLIDDKGVFLGDTWINEGSIFRESLWPEGSQPIPTGNWLKFWRERFQQALEFCDAFITTSESARDLILKTMPRLAKECFLVIPHGRDFTAFHRIRQNPKKGRPIRILVPGNVNAAKGLEIIRALIEHDKSERLEFYILGDLIGEAPKKGIVALGSYKRDEFAEKASSVHPHLGIIFSIWDETYCHTLTELWSVGLPVAVLDFPNVADRVRRTGAGWVLDHKNIAKLYDEIIRLAFDELELEKTGQALADWQSGFGMANSSAQMAAGYLNIYGDLLCCGSEQKKTLSPYSRKRIGVVCPASDDLRQAPGSTHIRVWERTHNAVERNVSYIRMTPAMLIACVREKMLNGVIIQRTAIPKKMVEDVITVLAQSNIPYSLELDDDLLGVPGDKDPQGIYAEYAPALRLLISSAAAITVSSPELQEKIKHHHRRVVLLPNRLSNHLWRKATQARRVDGKVRALYMGSATHDDDLTLVLPALDAVAVVSPHFRLSLVGITMRNDLTCGRPWLEVLKIPKKDYVNFTQWLQSQKNRFDFGIAPLRETSFNANKSDLKLIDYGALGLPVVASDVNNYRTVNAPGIRLVSNEMQEWICALSEQIALGAENHTLGEQLRQWVLRHRMLEETLGEYDSLILELTS